MTESTKTKESVIKDHVQNRYRDDWQKAQKRVAKIEKVAVIKMEATVLKTKRTKHSGQGKDRDKAGARILAEEWGDTWGAVSLEKQKLRKREKGKEKKSQV